MAKNRGGTESLKRKIDMLNRIKTQTPSKVGTIIVNHFKDNFNIGGYVNESVNLWKPRKKKYSHPILVKTGKLKGSIKKSFANWQKVIVESNTKYGYVHNFGVGRMPQRKFMGNSRKMNSKIIAFYESTLNRVMKA